MGRAQKVVGDNEGLGRRGEGVDTKGIGKLSGGECIRGVQENQRRSAGVLFRKVLGKWKENDAKNNR